MQPILFKSGYLATVICLSVYDFFDYVAFATLAVITLLIASKNKAILHIPKIVLIIAGSFCSLTLLTLISAQNAPDTRHIIGILASLTFGCLVYVNMKVAKRILLNCIKISAALVLLVFAVQWIYGKLGILTLDVTGVLSDISSRIAVSDPDDFRGSAIFQEPNSFCVFCYLICSTLIFSREKSLSLQLVALTLMLVMVFSNSLWGLGAAALLMGLFAIERQKKPIIFLAIVLVVSHPVWLSGNLQWRIVNFANDTSVAERLVKSTSPTEITKSKIREIDSTAIKKIDCDETGGLRLLFGNGATSSCFQQFFGVNTISYLLYSYGIFGLLFLAVVSWIYDEHRLKLRFICLLPLLLTYPYFTYFIFPFFIAFLYDSHVPRKTSQQHHINV